MPTMICFILYDKLNKKKEILGFEWSYFPFIKGKGCFRLLSSFFFFFFFFLSCSFSLLLICFILYMFIIDLYHECCAEVEENKYQSG
jgi:hypothetical protein